MSGLVESTTGFNRRWAQRGPRREAALRRWRQATGQEPRERAPREPGRLWVSLVLAGFGSILASLALPDGLGALVAGVGGLGAFGGLALLLAEAP